MKGRLFVVAAILGVFSAGALGAASPRDAAKEWAAEMGFDVKGITCTPFDTDRDGYVSCDLNVGEGRVVSIQCAAPDGHGRDSSGCYTPVTGCKGSKSAPARVPQ